MKPLLKDPAAQQHVDREGYVVTRLFSPRQVQFLLDLYDRHIRASEVSGLYESSRNKSYEVNRSINEAIHDVVVVAGRDVFLPAKIYGGSFMVKAHKSSDVLPLHQDWSVVEEDKYQTLFVWCPLVDVSVVNGGLFVLPGSHKYFTSLRSGSYPSNRYVLPPELHACTRDVPLRAGEAILYSDALFHGSHANNGHHDRVVVTARVMEEDADLVYFHSASDDDVDVIQADEAFYLTHIDALAKGRVPADVRRLSRRPYRHVPVTDEGLQAKIRQHFQAPGAGTIMKPLFKDAQLQKDFERDGFVVIDLLDRGQVDALMAFYSGLSNAPTPEGGFQVSLDNERPEFVQSVSDMLMATVRANVDRHFEGHQIFTASFVTKQRSPIGVVPPHQDWTFVDESRFWSATIWCPLIDVDAENGALGLIKGSHRFYDHVRPSPSPQYSPPFKDQLAAIFPYLTLVPLRAGQAVVFNNQTLHASPPNATSQTRVAFGIGITQREATLRHYYLLPGQERPVMEGYDVTPEFFFSYNNARLSALHDKGERPKDLNSIGVFAVQAKRYETDALVNAIKAAGNTENVDLARRAAAVYGQRSDDVRKIDSPATPNLPLWKVYTPGNIVREIRYRLSRR